MEQFKQLSEKDKMFKVLSVFLVIASVWGILQAVGTYKENKFIGTDEIGSTISFSGEGEVFAVPDVASFGFSVTEESSTATQAQEDSATKINAILGYLDEQGIKEKDIKTTNYNVYPRYEWRDENPALSVSYSYPRPGGTRVLVGYEVNQTITVKVRETEKAGTILSGVGELGATNISGLNFTIDDEDELKREARKLAIKDAKDKASELSRDLGVKLIRIVSFNESGAYPQYDKVMFAMEDMEMGVGGAVTPEIPMGENKITSNITITYEIR